MEPAFPSVIPVHGRVGVGASLVHSMVISVLHSFLGLSSVLSTLTKEHSREGQGVQSFPHYGFIPGGDAVSFGEPNNVLSQNSRATKMM